MALLATTDIPAAPVLVFMAFGVIMAMFGHASKSRTLIVTGILILFMATAAMVAGAWIAYHGGETTDPRPAKDPKEPGF
jgi:membrane protein DedA with SNARE-associated domain